MKRLRPFVSSVILGLVLFLGACSSSDQAKLLISVNDAQDAAAQTYVTASKQESDASVKCRAALLAASRPLPTTPDQIKGMCADVGAPVPYDPVKLQQASVAVNSLYDGVRAANSIRSASKQDLPASVLQNLATLFVNVIAELTAAGISVPPNVSRVAGALGGQ
jgi:hypothetical protein